MQCKKLMVWDNVSYASSRWTILFSHACAKNVKTVPSCVHYTMVIACVLATFLLLLPLLWRLQPNRGLWPPRSWGFYITHNDAPLSVGLLWTSRSACRRPLPDNTQHSQQTDIHAPGGIRIHNLSRQKAADLRLRPCGHWDRRQQIANTKKK